MREDQLNPDLQIHYLSHAAITDQLSILLAIDWQDQHLAEF